jgi:hypothetical protein
MRYLALVFPVVSALFTVAAHAQTTRADPYRWCAEYSSPFGDGGTNCYFATWQQCQAAVSGTGGFCRRNLFYTGPNGDERRAFRGQRRHPD